MTARAKRHAATTKMNNAIYGVYPDVQRITPHNNEYEYMLLGALNYGNVAFEHPQLKQFAVDYCKQFLPSVSVRSVPDWCFFHLGLLCWIRIAGGELRQQTCNEMNSRLTDLSRDHVRDENVVLFKKKVTRTISVETVDYIDAVHARLFDMVDGNKKMDLPVADGVDQVYALQKVENIYNELALASSGSNADQQLVEAFESTSKSCLATQMIFLEKVVEQLSSIKGKPKKMRIVRARKINPVKMVKYLTYMRSFDELKIKSIQPEKIVGCKILWVYNTKTRRLGRYEGDDGVSLQVKRSSIINYSPTLSVEKTLRKPEEQLASFEKASKVELRKFLDGFKGITKQMNGRINKYTILLAAY